MKIETKRIVVFESADYYLDIPERLQTLVKFWQWHLDQIPWQYRDSAEIETEVRDEYGAPTIYYTLSYIRPETDEEAAQREAALIAKREEQEALERATLEELLKKYTKNAYTPSSASALELAEEDGRFIIKEQ